MQPWEIIVVAVGGVLVITNIYLITALIKLNKLIVKLDALVAKNTASINTIVENVDSLTTDAKDAVGKLKKTVEQPSDTAKGDTQTKDADILDGVKTVVTAAGFAYTLYKYLKERSRNKKINRIYKDIKRGKIG